jgi:hypothetical protein
LGRAGYLGRMGIGIGIVLLVLGLILVTGAVDLPASVDDAIAGNTLGWIFLVVGALAIVLALVLNRQRTRPAATQVTERRYEA